MLVLNSDSYLIVVWWGHKTPNTLLNNEGRVIRESPLRHEEMFKCGSVF